MERSPTYEPLPECEQRFRAAFAQAAIGMAIIDPNGYFTYANAALCRITGYSLEELRGMHFTETLHPADRAERLVAFDQFVSGKIDSYNNERRMTRKDGRGIWVKTSITVTDQLLAPVRVIALVQDITEQKLAEHALRASEERFRIAAENASDIIYEWDLKTGEIATFGRNQRLGNWPCPLSYEKWKSILHPEDRERVISQFEQYLANPEDSSFHQDCRIVGTDGKIYTYTNRGQTLRDAAGQPYKLVGLSTDITQKKKAEEAISQLAAIVQCSENAIFATDLRGCITTWNTGAQQLLGYQADEAIGSPIAKLFFSPELASAILVQIERGVSARLHESLFQRKDGTQVPVLLTVSPIGNTDGRPTGSAVIARDISDRKQVEREMAYRVLHDHLTGLPNRLLLLESLAHSIAHANSSGTQTAVIFIDLDGFKFVNDTLGHEAGDRLLQQAAQRLNDSIRHRDLLARMGGDEFVLIVDGLTNDQVAVRTAERLAAALRRPFSLGAREQVVTASMGISVYPRDGSDASALCRNADAAMYAAKQAGKDRIRFYTPALGAAFQARLEMEGDLRRALDRGEFYLHFQPVFKAVHRTLTAYEALARWRHPSGRLIPPAEFVPVAEETGLIHALGEWVLRRACRQCRSWQKDGRKNVRVAVNVSSLQFSRSDFVGSVLAVLRQTDLSGHLLDLELTESIVMRDVETTIDKMAQLRQHGIRILVDDFGTGYSSLAYLPKLPIDILKIDRCFVTQIDTNPAVVPLIQGMISLAHSLSKTVIVEGVETREQLDILRALGCDEVQGFLLGRPARLEHDAGRTDPEQLTA